MNLAQKYGDWALITGASSGIGKAFAKKLAGERINLVIVARRFERLQKLAGELSSLYNIKVIPVKADLTTDNFLDVIREATNNQEINILVNNAGIGSTGLFVENDMSVEINMVKTNCLAPLILTHHYIRKMAEKKKGAIIFLGSIVGFQPTAYEAAYAATKAFNIYLGAAMYHELRNTNIDVLSLSPGGTRTEFLRLSSISKGPFSSEPEEVVETALKYLGKKPSVVHGFFNKLLTIGGRTAPFRISVYGAGLISKYLYWKRK